MSMMVPKRFSREEFRKLTDKKLNTDDFKQYIHTVRESYDKPPKGGTEYVLKNNLSEDELARLDYIFKRTGEKRFDSLDEIARYFRRLLEEKKYIILYAFNGTGKTRLSVEFKTLGQRLTDDTGRKTADTLYYNAFTEDLFYWHNDLENDTERYLEYNGNSRFFAGLDDLEMESRIRRLLHRYTDFDFKIKYEERKIRFHRDVVVSGTSQRVDNIKVSRGEERLFIWCFFLAILWLIADKEESYDWVKYIYIDDPISSLDDNNVIAAACHLAEIIRESDVKVVVSSHHTLFYNVLCNEIKRPEQLFLQRKGKDGEYTLRDTGKTPFFHHIAMLKELQTVSVSGQIYAYHFNMLRNVLEKTASFHGYKHFSDCLRKDEDEESPVYKRLLDLLSHGNYSVFEARELVDDNKEYFRTILSNFLEDYKFNQKVIESEQAQEENE